jgi:DNA-binding ferritin-like protein
MTSLANHINFFFTLREQIKLYHWQTHMYSRHKATDEVIDSLDKVIDEFVETWMGKYGRPRLSAKTGTFHVANMSDAGAAKFIRACVKYLEGPLVAGLAPAKDSDLLNLRDEMLGELNKLQYLFSLH